MAAGRVAATLVAVAAAASVPPATAAAAAAAAAYNCSARPNTLTSVSIVAGSVYEGGYLLGRASALQVRAYLGDADVQAALAYAAAGPGAALSAAMLATTNATFPQWVTEMRGLADGAGVPFASIVALNQLAELQAVMPPSRGATRTPHCTDILLAGGGGGGPWIAHNEDGDVEEDGLMFLATVTYTRDVGLANYTAYMYPGLLATTAFGFNSAGLLVSQNAVFPTTSNGSGVPAEVLSRAVMDARSVDAAVAVLTGTPCAGGASFNLAGVGGGDTVVNVETSPQGVVTAVAVPGGSPRVDYYYHVNMYRHTPVPQVDDPSSDARLARLQALPPPTSAADALAALGDTANATWPIYRNGSEADGVITLITGLFTVTSATTATLALYTNNPKYCAAYTTLPITVG